MGSGAPPPPNFTGLAQQQADQQNVLLNQQTQTNRATQNTPFAQVTWGPNGQQTSFNGPLGSASTALQQQAAQSLGTPFSLAGLGALGTGDSARDQAISSAYNQASSRLDPQFSQREEALRSRLANQGLQEGSEAYNREMDRLGQQRNDAYSSAMSNAIGQGTAAQSAVFGQNMASRQQALSELLRQRGQPLADLQQMQGFLAMPGYTAAGQGQAANLLQAGTQQDASAFRNWQAEQQRMADMISAGTQLVGSAGSMFAMSDERAKDEVTRLGVEVAPGVEAVSFRYKPEHGLGTARHVGVLAQDVRRRYPSAVRTRKDGLLEVHPAFAPVPLED